MYTIFFKLIVAYHSDVSVDHFLEMSVPLTNNFLTNYRKMKNALHNTSDSSGLRESIFNSHLSKKS